MKQGFQLIKQSALSTTLKRNDRLGILLTHLILGGFFYPQKTNKCLKLMSIYGKI